MAAGPIKPPVGASLAQVQGGLPGNLPRPESLGPKVVQGESQQGQRFGSQVYDPLPLSRSGRDGTFFYQVLPAILHSRRAARRSGWNGKGMFIFYVPGSSFTVEEGRPMAAFFAPGTAVQYHGHIDMKTAQGDVVPWLCSQTDMIADDWELVPEGEV